jgi:hypothetical protein
MGTIDQVAQIEDRRVMADNQQGDAKSESVPFLLLCYSHSSKSLQLPATTYLTGSTGAGAGTAQSIPSAASAPEPIPP